MYYRLTVDILLPYQREYKAIFFHTYCYLENKDRLFLVPWNKYEEGDYEE
jgi:hypothetical protein